MELNRWHWDEVVPIHARSRFYNVDSFLSGKSSLLPVGIEARFIHSNIYNLNEVLEEEFDIVFTSYGVLCWLPDLRSWARTIADHLRPGGVFYIVEDHPLASLIDEQNEKGISIGYPYFSTGGPLKFEGLGTYTDRSAELVHDAVFEWQHPLSEIVNAILEAGLQIEFLHEFPYGFFQRHPRMVRAVDRTWRFEDPAASFPLIFSLKARKM